MPVPVLLAKLRPHPNNPRHQVDPEYIRELAESLQEYGQRDAILVRPLPGDQYQIVAGHCRVLAVASIGWTEIRAEVQEMTDEEADFLVLDTNLKRRNLTEIEEAEGLRRMVECHGWTQQKAAQQFGKTQSWVSRSLRLLNLEPEVQQVVMNRFITPTAAAHIAQAPPELQSAIAKRVQDADLSTRETERLVKVVTNPSTPVDVRRAALENPQVTAAHAEALARIPEKYRAGIIDDIERGRMTPEMATREAQNLTRTEAIPASVAEARGERRDGAYKPLLKVYDELVLFREDQIPRLADGDLSDLNGTLGRLMAQIGQLQQKVRAEMARRRSAPKDGRVVSFPKA